MASKLKITQVRSAIRQTGRQKRTLEALGLRRMHQTVLHNDTPQIRGMVDRVSHLVTLELETDAKPTARKAPERPPSEVKDKVKETAAVGEDPQVSSQKEEPAKKAAAQKSAAKKSTTKKSTAKKSTAKKSAAKKSAAKKSSARKTTAKKTTTRKSAAKKSSGGEKDTGE